MWRFRDNRRKGIHAALALIHKGDKGVGDGFHMLQRLGVNGTCPDEILAVVHTKGSERGIVIEKLGLLIADFHLNISGERLLAEDDKASGSDIIVRPAICAFASYQTGRKPMDIEFGGPMPPPKPLDEVTLNLLSRALHEKEPALRLAAADSIRLAGCPENRFIEPLLSNDLNWK